MSLKSTVQNLRNRADDARYSQRDREGFIEAWRVDVADLYARIRSSLLQVIDDEAVDFKMQPMTVLEEELGNYDIDAMTVTIVDRIIHIEPIARMTIGGTGRVDLYRSDRPSEDDRIFIVRGTAEAGHMPDEWLIETKRSQSIEEAAVRFVVRGYRTYLAMTPDSLQSAVDVLLNLR